ncbi:hypothetical protein [Microcystis phage vB_MweS-yong2]|nr:hypothetical protein [Microcystis phage vB_MweS-yong2]
MSDFSNHLETAICNVLRGTALAGVTPHVALFSAMPNEAGAGGTEVTTDVRPAGRLPVTFGAPAPDGTGTQIANSADINFGNSAGSPTIVGWGLYDAAVAGNLLALKTLAAPQVVTAGNPVDFLAGALKLKVD